VRKFWWLPSRAIYYEGNTIAKFSHLENWGDFAEEYKINRLDIFATDWELLPDKPPVPPPDLRPGLARAVELVENIADRDADDVCIEDCLDALKAELTPEEEV